MGCPNCNRESVISLSICPTCGTMVNDSVREELAARITRGYVSTNIPGIQTAPPKSTERGYSSMPKAINQIQLKPSPKNISTKPTHTSEIIINKTNRTLIEFQPQESKKPEWRLQLQNAVQQRNNSRSGNTHSAKGARPVTIAEAQNIDSETQSNLGENRLIASALNRIELSRSKYLIADEKAPARPNQNTEPKIKAKKKYPFTVASPSKVQGVPVAPTTNKPIKPALKKPAPVQRSGKDLYDTNELEPEFLEAAISTSFDKRPLSVPNIDHTPPRFELTEKIAQHKGVTENSAENVEDLDGFDDYAPIALRFNSALFDLIIGSFITMILLAPFVLLGGTWFTMAGFLGFLAALSFVMFIYLTTSIGFFGKSFGMHLFSLEMIDIEGDEYPTFHQAAVSSSVFILSLALGGIGFLTSLFDEDRRAAHDLASGTIIVKEL